MSHNLLFALIVFVNPSCLNSESAGSGILVIVPEPSLIASVASAGMLCSLPKLHAAVRNLATLICKLKICVNAPIMSAFLC